MRFFPVFLLYALITVATNGQSLWGRGTPKPQTQNKDTVLRPPFRQGLNPGLLGRGNPITGKKDSINIYLNFQDLWGLDLKEGTFCANFYTVMKSNGRDASQLQYLNGEMTFKYDDTLRKRYFESWNEGKFRTDMNFKDYPLDKQFLNIVIEAGEDTAKTLLYTSDKENNIIDRQHLTGWKIDTMVTQTAVHTYAHFNYGDSLSKHRYSRITVSIVIERTHKWVFLLKLFFPSFISMLILMIGFLFPAEKVDTRFGLGVASIFGVISSLILIQQNLPDLARFTLIELLNYIAILTVFATLVIFGVSYGRYKKKKRTKGFDRISFTVLILFYVLASLLILFLRS